MQMWAGPSLLSSGLDMCERALALKEAGKRAAGTFISRGWLRGASAHVYAHVHASRSPEQRRSAGLKNSLSLRLKPKFAGLWVLLLMLV